MTKTLHTRARSESGFTLVELLVVMLVLGLLASIAIPAFFNQRIKAEDSEAKSIVRTAQTALETYAMDHNGAYTGATRTLLHNIEPTLSTSSSGFNTMRVLTIGAKNYTITVRSVGGTDFSVTRSTTGALTYPCSKPGIGGCVSGGWG